jgi:ribonuclease HII
MPYLIGTDEAGYGPNLGPLVVTATVWHVADTSHEPNLYDTLKSKDGHETCPSVEFGDSKALYKPGGTLAKLERGVMAAIGCLPRAIPATWRQLLALLDATCLTQIVEVPWYVDYDRPIPIEIQARDAHTASRQLVTAFTAGRVRLVDIRSRILFPNVYNERVEQCGSKGMALSEWTLELVRSVMKPLHGEPIMIRCDKHGGRNRYAAVLQHVFADQLVQVLHESRSESAYQWLDAGHGVEIRFTAKGERFLPTALASMVSKYSREVIMAAFNQFWMNRVPGLKPTAGYPVDARRFLNDIARQKERLGIPDHAIWRQR